jgi:hypothetical protein
MAMAGASRDGARETRIRNGIIVDAYKEGEPALAWHTHLEEHVHVPFRARCVAVRTISPLHEGEVVTVTGMAPEDDSMHEMLVMVQWQDRTLGVPLAQLAGIDVDDETAEAIADWHYWMAQGYGSQRVPAHRRGPTRAWRPR